VESVAVTPPNSRASRKKESVIFADVRLFLNVLEEEKKKEKKD